MVSLSTRTPTAGPSFTSNSRTARTSDAFLTPSTPTCSAYPALRGPGTLSPTSLTESPAERLRSAHGQPDRARRAVLPTPSPTPPRAKDIPGSRDLALRAPAQHLAGRRDGLVNTTRRHFRRPRRYLNTLIALLPWPTRQPPRTIWSFPDAPISRGPGRYPVAPRPERP